MVKNGIIQRSPILGFLREKIFSKSSAWSCFWRPITEVATSRSRSLDHFSRFSLSSSSCAGKGNEVVNKVWRFVKERTLCTSRHQKKAAHLVLVQFALAYIDEHVVNLSASPLPGFARPDHGLAVGDNTKRSLLLNMRFVALLPLSLFPFTCCPLHSQFSLGRLQYYLRRIQLSAHVRDAVVLHGMERLACEGTTEA